MSRGTFRPDWQRAIIALSAIVITLALVGLLYWGRAILIPFALAVFFTFVLTPLVNALQRRHVPRVPAVMLVVGLSVVALLSVGAVIGNQLAGLMNTLPDNAENIKSKIGAVRGWVATDDTRMSRFLTEIQEAISPGRQANADPSMSTEAPKVVVAEQSSWMTRIEPVAGQFAEFLGQAALSFVLVVFMLLKKEDLRNRILRLVAYTRVTRATKAFDEASRRISRYLLTQLILNSAFGVVITLGLFLIGVQYAPLWGFLATLMRYVPYIGTWIGVIPPVLFSTATSVGFTQPVLVFALFIGLEVICNNVFEPWLYGASLGMSEVAQLVAAAFWSFLWGPIGLILSGPLTTCLVVLGKYVPQLKFLDILLGDDPPLEPAMMYFQRLTARDQDEALRIVAAAGSKKCLGDVYDSVLVPALVLAKQANEDGDLEPSDEKFIHSATREILEVAADDAMCSFEGQQGTIETEQVRVLLSAARDETDELAARMLGRVLDDRKWEVEVAASETLTSELLERIEAFRPAVLVVSSLPPGGLTHTRYLCKRVRNRFPDLKVIVGRWGDNENPDETKTQLEPVGIENIQTTLVAAANQLTTWQSILLAKQGSGTWEGIETTGPTEADLVGTGPA